MKMVVLEYGILDLLVEYLDSAKLKLAIPKI